MSNPLTSDTLLIEAHALLTAATIAGAFDTPHGPMETALRTSIIQWLRQARSAMSTLPAAEALELAEAYDTLYVAAYATAPAPGHTFPAVSRALKAHRSGDTAVDPYRLFRMIDRGLARRHTPYFGAPLAWHSHTLAHWHRQFAYGTCFEPLSDYDTRQRVALLLQSDLRPFEPLTEATYKQTLRNNYPLPTPGR
ncbi:MAG: hypothetical protein K2M61_03605 [Muribaculaceae bacterium]|nr:hypothetical protein [Muribaculaceae bacterium]